MKRYFLVLLLLISCSCLMAQKVNPLKGEGTLGNPYIISNLDDLKYLTENSILWSSVFIQNVDIDASVSKGWNNGAGMMSIGDGKVIFTGSYDGQGHIIEGIYMNRPTVNFTGLFGYTEKAIIKNLGVVNVDITGNNAVGGFIALNQSFVSDCFSTGKVAGALNVGGFCGRNDQTSHTENCYSRCSVYGTRQVGGFVGYNKGWSGIINCYSTGKIEGNGYFFGGFIGLDDSLEPVENSFWDMGTSGKTLSSDGKGFNTVEMKIRESYTNSGWDFKVETINGAEEKWNIGNGRNDGYPYLNWQYPDDKTLAFIETSEISNIKTTTAQSGGNITNDGGSFITEKGICWSKTPFPDIAGLHTSDGEGNDPFTSSVSGLINNTSYYLRAYATNESGTSYSPQVFFTTAILDGKGTSDDPVIISTIYDLKMLSENSVYWDKYIIQTENIDASETKEWNDGEGWIPIGNAIKSFTGVYDGRGHLVSGLYISRPDEDYQGFFGWTSKAVLQNLGIEGCDITGYDFVGGLTSFNESNVSYCFSTGRVTGNDYVGLLLGMNYNDSAVRYCYSIGSTVGREQVGGLIGSNFSKTITENCYSSGSVKGVSFVGGLIGNNTSNLITSFWDTEISGTVSSNVGIKKTNAEMVERQTFINGGWDFKGEIKNGVTEIWNIANGRNNSYPYFNWQYPDDPVLAYLITAEANEITISSASSGGEIISEGGSAIIESGVCFSTTTKPDISSFTSTGVLEEGKIITLITDLKRNTKYFLRAYVINASGVSYGNEVIFNTLLLNGAGTESDPYLISSSADLKVLSENSFLWDKYFTQENNINMSESVKWDDGKGWIPIGNSTLKFSGKYDGKSHTIDSLFINRSTDSYIGFFGWTSNSQVMNIGLRNFNIKGSYGVGGIVGNNYNSRISSCFTTGIINGSSNAGGLVGRNYNSVIENSYSKAEVSGSDCIGGLIGNNLKEAEISFCYSTGKVTGVTNIGGLTGANSATVSNSFWDTDISGQKYSSGGAGLSTAQMKYRPEYVESGWDFKGEDKNGKNEYWNISSKLNDSYPFLNWEYPMDTVVGLPEILTIGAIDITTESANIGGGIISDGGAEILEKGVCWGVEMQPSLLDSVEFSEEEEVDYSFLIKGLKDSTTYYFRAFAKNLAGIVYGDELSFTTKKIEDDTLGFAELYREIAMELSIHGSCLTIEGEKIKGNTVQVVDINGRVVYRRKASEAVVEVVFSKKGFYIVSVISNKGMIISKKIQI